MTSWNKIWEPVLKSVIGHWIQDVWENSTEILLDLLIELI